LIIKEEVKDPLEKVKSIIYYFSGVDKNDIDIYV